MMDRGFKERVARSARRMREARNHGQRLWIGLGLVGALGWMVILPMVGGLYLGRYLDQAFQTRPSFTLSFLLIGLGTGAYSVWRFFLRGVA